MGSLEVIRYSNNGGTSTTELFFFKTTGWKGRVRYLKGWKDITKGEYSTQVHLQNYLILLDNHCMILWTEWNTQATYYSQKQFSQSLDVILDRASPWMDHTLANSKTNPTNWTTIKFHTTRLLCKTKEGVIDRLIDCFLHLINNGCILKHAYWRDSGLIFPINCQRFVYHICIYTLAIYYMYYRYKIICLTRSSWY